MTSCLEPSCGGPIECSDNGYCIFGTCFCFNGYHGVNCEHPPAFPKDVLFIGGVDAAGTTHSKVALMKIGFPGLILFYDVL